MRIAYADPPYPGQSKKHYADHPDYAGEVDHRALITRLVAEYEGWALSTSSQALQSILALCPYEVRVLAWCKPIAPPMKNHGVFGWEPVIVRGARYPASDLRDYLVCSPEMYTFRPKPADHVIGQKPPAFCRWVFAWLGAREGDEFDDVFPGSGAVAREWAQFSAQGVLA